MLEGGYDLTALEGALAMTVRGLESDPVAPGGDPWEAPGTPGDRHLDEIERVRGVQKAFWGSL